jgi:hypothetical protein
MPAACGMIVERRTITPVGGYGILKALQSLYPHFGQSNVRLSYPGLPGSECVKTICMEHFGQLSRSENAGICAVEFASGMRDPPVTGGSTTGLSAIDARRSVAIDDYQCTIADGAASSVSIVAVS